MFIPLAFIFTAALFWGRGPRPAPPRPPTTEEMGDTEDDDWERLVDTYHSLSEKISVHFGYIPSREGVKLAMEQREALELFKKLPYDLQELIRASLAPKSRVNQSQVFSMWIRPNDNTEEVRVMVRVNEEGFTLTTCDGEVHRRSWHHSCRHGCAPGDCDSGCRQGCYGRQVGSTALELFGVPYENLVFSGQSFKDKQMRDRVEYWRGCEHLDQMWETLFEFQDQEDQDLNQDQ